MTSLIEESCDWYWVRLVIQGKNYSGKELPLILAWGRESPQVPDIPHSKQTLARAQLVITALSSYVYLSNSFQSTAKLCRSLYKQHREYLTQPFFLTTFLLSVKRLSGGRTAPKLDIRTETKHLPLKARQTLGKQALWRDKPRGPARSQESEISGVVKHSDGASWSQSGSAWAGGRKVWLLVVESPTWRRVFKGRPARARQNLCSGRPETLTRKSGRD